MLCTHCGKDIPFTGKVCPYCHHDKADDQVRHARQSREFEQEKSRTLVFVLVGLFILLALIYFGAQ